MKTIDRTHATHKPFLHRPRTIDDLLDTFVDALNADDYGVDLGSRDPAGLQIVDTTNGLLYRLTLAEDGMLDDAEWQQRSSANYEYFLRQQEARRRIEEDGDDCRGSAFLGEDPAGFNGQENPDDVEF